jgi:hypothetical protein
MSSIFSSILIVPALRLCIHSKVAENLLDNMFLSDYGEPLPCRGEFVAFNSLDQSLEFGVSPLGGGSARRKPHQHKLILHESHKEQRDRDEIQLLIHNKNG